MKLITALNGDANQELNVTLDDGTLVQLSLTYSQNQQGWFYSFTYGTFTVNNRRLVVNPNMIRSFRNFLPFGIACTSVDGYEPIFQTDFSTSRISLYVLNASDVLAAETLITQTIPNALGNFLN